MIKYKAKFEKDDDGFSVTFPDLRGCFSYGLTLMEAQESTIEALDL